MGRRDGWHNALVIDFDGTIVDSDVTKIALDHFGDPHWMRIDEAYERGEISFEESLRREFATLNAPPELIVQEVSRHAAVRPSFNALVEHCRTADMPITVASGGLDFCIRHFLKKGDWLRFMNIHCPETQYTGRKYTVTFPKSMCPSSTNFKDDLVRQGKKNGELIAFVGDGFGDFAAAKDSDLVFAIKNSKLASLCRNHNIRHQEITNFTQLIDLLKVWRT